MSAGCSMFQLGRRHLMTPPHRHEGPLGGLGLHPIVVGEATMVPAISTSA